VARAVVLSPRVILADEPTGNLDPATGADVPRSSWSSTATTTSRSVVVTHNEELSRLVHRTLRLQHGKLH